MIEKTVKLMEHPPADGESAPPMKRVFTVQFERGDRKTRCVLSRGWVTLITNCA